MSGGVPAVGRRRHRRRAAAILAGALAAALVVVAAFLLGGWSARGTEGRPDVVGAGPRPAAVSAAAEAATRGVLVAAVADAPASAGPPSGSSRPEGLPPGFSLTPRRPDGVIGRWVAAALLAALVLLWVTLFGVVVRVQLAGHAEGGAGGVPAAGRRPTAC